MKHKAKILYRIVMIIAAFCGIIDVLFKLNFIPELPFVNDDENTKKSETPVVVVVEKRVEVPVKEVVEVPVQKKPLQNVSPKTSDQNVSQEKSDRTTQKNIDKPPEYDKVMIMVESFIGMKDFYNQQISELAADVNAHLNKNRDYRNARHLLDRAQNLVNDIRKFEEELSKQAFRNEMFKSQLIRVISSEFTRADGIREGVQSSINGGSWKAGFERGHIGKLQFEKENAALNKMYGELVRQKSVR